MPAILAGSAAAAAGAFGGLAIGLNGVITTIAVPLLAGVLAGP